MRKMGHVPVTEDMEQHRSWYKLPLLVAPQEHGGMYGSQEPQFQDCLAEVPSPHGHCDAHVERGIAEFTCGRRTAGQCFL